MNAILSAVISTLVNESAPQLNSHSFYTRQQPLQRTPCKACASEVLSFGMRVSAADPEQTFDSATKDHTKSNACRTSRVRGIVEGWLVGSAKIEIPKTYQNPPKIEMRKKVGENWGKNPMFFQTKAKGAQ
eukprot:3784607-Amphidinium_carterae.1